jgi:two-component sensor histidine kinase
MVKKLLLFAVPAILITRMMIGGICALLLLVGVLFNRYRSKQKYIRLLNEQREIIYKKNEALIQVVREKENLLKEVHHRVKNNFHLVMSLLNSQSKYLKDEVALSAILESQHRIHSMSLVHQKLYSSDNSRSIYMPEYIGEVVDYFKAAYKVGLNVLFVLDVEPIYLDAVYAVPLGLILNETITNSIKYAFPHGDHDKITVSLSISEDREVYLYITDNGHGLPETFDIHSTTSFGMILIKGLAADLKGSLVVESREGTTLSLYFSTRSADEGELA